MNKIDNGKADLLIKKILGRSSLITGNTINYPEHLMDVLVNILEDYKTVSSGSKIVAEITLYNLGTEEIKDTNIKYCIIKESGETIKCTSETMAVYTKIQVVKEFLISLDMPEGRYYLEVTSSYGNETANSRTTFLVKEKMPGVEQKVQLNTCLIIIIIIMVLVILIGIIYLKRNRPNKQTFSGSPLKVEPKKSGYIQAREEGYLIIKPKPIDEINNRKEISLETSYSGNSILSRLKEFIGSLWNKKYPKNSISGLVGKKVCSADGNYIGKISEVILGENRIDSLKIELDKKHKFDKKGIIISYKYVKNVGEIIIIDESVLEHLEKLV